MPAIIIEGKELAAEFQGRIRRDIEELQPKLGRKPRLAVVLVGDNPASQVYVRSKSVTAAKLGIEPIDVNLPSDIADAQLQSALRKLGAQPDLDGILLQLPLPNGLDEYAALMSIPPDKDVDGLHPLNQGLLLRGTGLLRPCTPLGVMALIDRGRRALGADSDLSGLRAVVVGRSVLVGKPVAAMLLERHCTVVMCHSRTSDLAAECRSADILVAAVGKPELVRGEWIKPGAIVIDVGINRSPDGKLLGDVHFASAQQVAGAITPVPGGVGPMTIVMLLANTVKAAQQKAVGR